MTQLVSEAKILAMPLLRLHGRKKQKRGRDPEEIDEETQRQKEKQMQIPFDSSLMTPVKRITLKSRERKSPPLVSDLCQHHYVHSESTLH